MPTGPTPAPDRQTDAAAWFRELRDLLCAEFEAIEGELTGTFSDREPGTFERTNWQRPAENGVAAGGGEMSVLRGRAFEKAGANFSEVRGVFSEEFRGQIKGTEDDPSFGPAGFRWCRTCARRWCPPPT